MHIIILSLFLAISSWSIALSVNGETPKQASTINTQKIEELTGLKGKMDEKEGAFKVTDPRKDLAIRVGGTKLTPAMGLTSWAAFKASGKGIMVMGDLVLLEDQVNPVMSVALDNGLSVTALHNHFFWDKPKVIFMHINGMGSEDKIAGAVGKVFAKIKETAGGKGEIPHGKFDPEHTNLNPQKIEVILGKKGELKDGVYKVTIGRVIQMHGTKIGNTMGVNTWAAFVGSDDNALVDGDFAMHETEVQDVLKALRHAGIYVVALHQHMLEEQPRIIFLHYWGIGSTTQLAQALQSALSKTKT